MSASGFTGRNALQLHGTRAAGRAATCGGGIGGRWGGGRFFLGRGAAPVLAVITIPAPVAAVSFSFSLTVSVTVAIAVSWAEELLGSWCLALMVSVRGPAAAATALPAAVSVSVSVLSFSLSLAATTAGHLLLITRATNEERRLFERRGLQKRNFVW
jgi:hypothetical protein